MSQVSIYDPNMLLFIDECGSDRKLALRKYGYALRGKRAVTDKTLIKGKRYTAIGIMCIDGMLDVYTTEILHIHTKKSTTPIITIQWNKSKKHSDYG